MFPLVYSIEAKMNVITFTFSFTNIFLRTIVKRVKFSIIKSMNRYIQNTIIFIKNFRSSIPTMNIPIKYRYLFYTIFLLSIFGSYCYIIKNTISITLRKISVVTRRSRCGENILALRNFSFSTISQQ